MKGFTLIELLIVIAILAILATTVVTVLNPAQMLAEARDSQRMSDLNIIRKAVALFFTTATDTSSFAAGPRCTATTTCPFSSCTVPLPGDVKKVDASGWVVANLTKSSGGSPLAVLPIDPVNAVASSSQYCYKGDTANKTFELDCTLESLKYSPKMASSSDGGDNDLYYEIGTDPGLDL